MGKKVERSGGDYASSGVRWSFGGVSGQKQCQVFVVGEMICGSGGGELGIGLRSWGCGEWIGKVWRGSGCCVWVWVGLEFQVWLLAELSGFLFYTGLLSLVLACTGVVSG